MRQEPKKSSEIKHSERSSPNASGIGDNTAFWHNNCLMFNDLQITNQKPKKIIVMNANQKNKFTMELALRDFLNQNATIISTLPNFEALFSTFSKNMDHIRQISEQQVTDLTGITKSKEQIRTELMDSTLDISHKLSAYAKMTENTVMEGEVWSSKSLLKKSQGSILTNRALLLYDKAVALQGELTVYGITSEGLASFKSAIDRYLEILPKTRLGITQKKQATGMMGQLFEENDLLLQKMDALVKIVRLSQPAFYSAYRDNRRVIFTGSNALALIAKVTDATSREALRGVTVRFTFQNGKLSPEAARFGTAVEKTTGEKGMFRVKNLKPGTYTALLSKPGYREQTIILSVAQGERTDITAEMERA